MNTKLEELKAVIVKANPEIMDWEELTIKGGKIAKVGREDYSKLSGQSWSINAKGYAFSKKVFLHRAVLDFDIPKNWFIDHINGDRLDNRRENLRAVKMSQNHMNKGSFGGTSKYKGVRLKKDTKRAKPWNAEIKIDGKLYSIGMFATEEEAAKAYDERAKFFYGEYAKLNFPVGRPIRLADVLLAIQAKRRREYGASSLDNTIKIEDERRKEDTFLIWLSWNLRDDDLSHQSEETINFLHKILVGEKDKK